MAAQVPTPCTHVGPEGPCPELATQRGRCDAHQRKAWATTTRSRHARGYDNAERRARDAYLAKHPTCEQPGCTRQATQADHVVPLSAHGARLDPNNLQALCTPHHATKTGREGQAARLRG